VFFINNVKTYNVPLEYVSRYDLLFQCGMFSSKVL
jgi:hypothetical protein